MLAATARAARYRQLVEQGLATSLKEAAGVQAARAREGREAKLQAQVDAGEYASREEALKAASRAANDAAGNDDHSAHHGPAMDFFFSTVEGPASAGGLRAPMAGFGPTVTHMAWRSLRS